MKNKMPSKKKTTRDKIDLIPEGQVQPLVKKVRKCAGCEEKQPNQQAHMGGCLPDWGESWF
jgi:hypothetical protein